MERVLLPEEGKNLKNIKDYLTSGGYEGLKKAVSMKSEDIISELKASNLLGRGGAGFPTWLKWDFTYKAEGSPKYVIANADESEPGTFKDRVLIEKNPHQIIEGLIIAGYTIGANEGFIFIRGEFGEQYEILKSAVEEARKEGFLGKNILNSGFDFDIKIYRGAGAYMSGEETALLESMEGKTATARGKPPYPAQYGFQGKPTLVNNVETLANIPKIILKGGNWYNSLGVGEAAGVKLFALSGMVKNPGVYELPLGIKLRELVENYGGGIIGEFKAVLPGSVSSGFITDLDVSLDYKSLMDAGSMLGSGAVVVINKEQDILDVCKNIVEFFYEESCGFCAPCRQGTKKAKQILDKISQGEGSQEDLEILKRMFTTMFDTCNCGLGQFALFAVNSAIEKFKDEMIRCGEVV